MSFTTGGLRKIGGSGPSGSGTSTGTNTGDVTLTAVGSAPAAAGASLSGQALTLQPADSTHPGLLSLSDQTLGLGYKTIQNSGAGATAGAWNSNPNGFSGIEYYNSGGGVAVFTGHQNATGEFRFNHVGAGATIVFKMASVAKLTIQNNGDVLTGQKLLATSGLGVGNSASATVAVGVLSAKMEVFDATGASIGFVPIYASIT